MTKVLIIEDEIPARKKLKRLIEKLDSPTEIIAELDTIESAITFLNQRQPDLIFSDIELLDGNAFEIYRQVSVTCPIIFTTAYNFFWMDAFDSNGIDYLLKPYSKERFQKAWDKFLLLRNSSFEQEKVVHELTKLLQQNFTTKDYKKRFSVKTYQGIYFLDTIDIIFFKAEEGAVFAHDSQNKRHLLSETTIKEIEEQLNPSDFFRINRSEIVQKNYIQKIQRYNKNILAIKLNSSETYLKTSQSKTSEFKEWITN